MGSRIVGELERTRRVAVECAVEEVSRFAETSLVTGGLLVLELGSAWMEVSMNFHEPSVLVEKPPSVSCEEGKCDPSFHL